MRNFVLALAALSFGAATAALAQSTAPEGQGPRNPAFQKVHEACQADMAKLCPNVQGPDRRKCMEDHASELSKPCADARAEAMAAMKANGGAPH